MKEIIKETLTKYNPESTTAEIETLTEFFEALCFKPVEDRAETDLEELEYLAYLFS